MITLWLSHNIIIMAKIHCIWRWKVGGCEVTCGTSTRFSNSDSAHRWYRNVLVVILTTSIKIWVWTRTRHTCSHTCANLTAKICPKLASLNVQSLCMFHQYPVQLFALTLNRKPTHAHKVWKIELTRTFRPSQRLAETALHRHAQMACATSTNLLKCPFPFLLKNACCIREYAVGAKGLRKLEDEETAISYSLRANVFTKGVHAPRKSRFVEDQAQMQSKWVLNRNVSVTVW